MILLPTFLVFWFCIVLWRDPLESSELSALNPIAFSMVPPAPDQCAQRAEALAGRSSKARTSISTNSSTSLSQRLAAIVAREDSRVFSMDAPPSLVYGNSSQQSQSVGLLEHEGD